MHLYDVNTWSDAVWMSSVFRFQQVQQETSCVRLCGAKISPSFPRQSIALAVSHKGQGPSSAVGLSLSYCSVPLICPTSHFGTDQCAAFSNCVLLHIFLQSCPFKHESHLICEPRGFSKVLNKINTEIYTSSQKF